MVALEDIMITSNHTLDTFKRIMIPLYVALMTQI